MRTATVVVLIGVLVWIALAEAQQPSGASKTAPQTSADDAFVKAVGAMPPEQRVKAVIARLKELNPGFDGKETHKIEGGAVTTLSISTVGVMDISPVRALQWLRTLTIAPAMLNQKGSLADLSPLKGMQLTWLWCHNNPISDLSPLKDMPLSVLGISGTRVTDLSPLAGMKLQVLSVNDTVVTDLAPLEGMPLTTLWCHNTRVTDLSPLKTMPLRELKCDFVIERDAPILRGMKTLARINDQPADAFWMRIGPTAGQPSSQGTGLRRDGVATSAPAVGSVSAKEQIRRFVEKMRELNADFDGQTKHVFDAGKIIEIEFSAMGVTNISAVVELKGLRKLTCKGVTSGKRAPLTDLSPLSRLRLRVLDCAYSRVKDLSPLRGLPLETFVCNHTEVGDLSGLAGAKLAHLTCSYNPNISDLTPLKGMPLEFLNCRGTKVSDLTPLRGAKLRDLNCGGTRIADLSTLEGMPLRNLFSDVTPISDLAPLKGASLKLVNCVRTQVRDLSPLKGAPLESLYCHQTQVTDFSPLKGMHVKDLTCDFVADRDTKVLRSVKSLDMINDLPVKGFWKRVDAGEVPQVTWTDHAGERKK